MRQRVRSALLGLDPISVENPVHPGTPDLNYTGGWIELKQLPDWPAPGRVVRIPHFTPQQRVWLTRRVRAGGRAFLLLRVGAASECAWLLFRGDKAAEIVGRVDRSQLHLGALASWAPHLDDATLRTYLTA